MDRSSPGEMGGSQTLQSRMRDTNVQLALRLGRRQPQLARWSRALLWPGLEEDQSCSARTRCCVPRLRNDSRRERSSARRPSLRPLPPFGEQGSRESCCSLPPVPHAGSRSRTRRIGEIRERSVASQTSHEASDPALPAEASEGCSDEEAPGPARPGVGARRARSVTAPDFPGHRSLPPDGVELADRRSATGILTPRAQVAQLAEHGSEEPGVAGSIPALGTHDHPSVRSRPSCRRLLGSRLAKGRQLARV